MYQWLTELSPLKTLIKLQGFFFYFPDMYFCKHKFPRILHTLVPIILKMCSALVFNCNCSQALDRTVGPGQVASKFLTISHCCLSPVAHLFGNHYMYISNLGCLPIQDHDQSTSVEVLIYINVN